MDTQEQFRRWQQMDAAHFLHPFSDSKQIGERGTRIITRGEGVYLYDGEGRKLLDGMSGLWCVAVGYGRRELADIAARQMNELPYYNSFFQCATPPAIELAAKLAEITPPQFQHVFFTGSGSESVDTVIRLARRYWQLEGQPERNIIIGRWNGYHGSTIAGASLGGMKWMHEQGLLPMPGIEHINQPYWFERGGGLSPEEFGLRTARELEECILRVGPARVAAFIGEPVQGAGGVIIPPDSYWPEIQRICDQYGILLISDEVICGFGRTGRWFGCEHFGARPDLMTMAKALSSGYLPIGGVMVGDRVASTLIAKGGEFAHGFTYSAHPVCSAVALGNLEIIQREKLVDHVRDTAGPHLQRRWAALADHPLVGEARGVGLLGALELVKGKSNGGPPAWFEPRGKVGERCRDNAIANGLVMRATRDTMIIAPPLCITPAEIDELVDKAWRTLDMTFAGLKQDGWL
ncbi:MAG TPA: aspartate aminotransferase family protein [Steroidobacteraceae bacterium]|nr:aspartate aminotransferase family protein [Steroidobacteraceae bacterium]